MALLLLWDIIPEVDPKMGPEGDDGQIFGGCVCVLLHEASGPSRPVECHGFIHVSIFSLRSYFGFLSV